MKFGDYRVEIVPDCEFRLDGGAMFGVVPRNLWSKVAPPDDQNRIRMNMNCLFIEAGDERILIDTGIGDKWSEKHREMYGIDRQRSFDESLRAIAGVSAEQITIVINTHLHFDHAGGNTKLDESGKVVAAFANARYFISRAEYEHAEGPTERDRASFRRLGSDSCARAVRLGDGIRSLPGRNCGSEKETTAAGGARKLDVLVLPRS